VLVRLVQLWLFFFKHELELHRDYAEACKARHRQAKKGEGDPEKSRLTDSYRNKADAKDGL
jgi:hypothetical protein